MNKFIGNRETHLRTSSERSLDMTDSIGDNNENNAESANTKKKEVILKKPQASLLQAYPQNCWKQANNHFLRYSDVKVREERRPSVMDLANQPGVLQRVNGWKTHLISSEITEMVWLVRHHS